jgi:hypothetical protein
MLLMGTETYDIININQRKKFDFKTSKQAFLTHLNSYKVAFLA